MSHLRLRLRSRHLEPFSSDSEPEWECKYCGITGSQSLTQGNGHQHRVLRDGCCPRAEGARFRCNKRRDNGIGTCPEQLVVMYGKVFAIDPYSDDVICLAGRGKDHTVRHRCNYHDYWCDQIPDGMVNVWSIASEESAKMRRAYTRKVQQAEMYLKNFQTAADRLVSLLPTIENNSKLVGIPAGKIEFVSDSLATFADFHDLESFYKCENALQKASSRLESVRYNVRSMVAQVQHVRCIRQLGRQKFKNRTLVDIVVAFLGRKSLLPTPRLGIFFAFEEENVVEAVVHEQGSANNIEMERVIQIVEHSEPAAVREPELLGAQADHDWADQVVHLHQQQGVTRIQDMREDNFEASTEPILLLEYKRCPESFLKALSENPALSTCRMALSEAGFAWMLPSGAKIFVHPWQFEDVMQAMNETQIQLRKFHVIVSKSLEYNVESALSDLSCRQGVRLRQRNLLIEATADCPGEDHDVACSDTSRAEAKAEDDDHDEGLPWEVERTFICEARRLRNPNSVTQSTTEAREGCMNPRRATAMSSSGP